MRNLSFGSSFNFNIRYNYPHSVMNRLSKLEEQGAKVITEIPDFDESVKKGIIEKVYASIDDKDDAGLITLLQSSNVYYTQRPFSEVLNAKNLYNRVELSSFDSSEGYSLVDFDTSTIDELYKKNSPLYIGPKGEHSIGNSYAECVNYLKTGKKIDAPKIRFRDFSNRLSFDILNANMTFACLRDFGVKKIPMSIDKESLEIAKKYGLVSE